MCFLFFNLSLSLSLSPSHYLHQNLNTYTYIHKLKQFVCCPSRLHKLESMINTIHLFLSCCWLLVSTHIHTRTSSLPLSRATLQGLSKNEYSRMTLIQRRALPPALRGKDVLGAAKTGSGKTLAFVIPLLDRLYRERWGHSDGLGALIITPTRELGIQIFEVLRKVWCIVIK